MKRLQIEIQGDVIGDEKPEFKVTPIDIELPDTLAHSLQQAFQVADAFDSEPGDGELDQVFKTKVPIKLNLLFTKLNTSVEVKGKATIRIKDEPVDSPDEAA